MAKVDKPLREPMSLTLSGQPIDPWWNMVAVRRLKKEFNVRVQDVLNDIFDPDKIVPFYLVGLDAREPGKYTLETVEQLLDFRDLMQLQKSMADLVKEFGLDAIPLNQTNGEKPGLSLVST